MTDDSSKPSLVASASVPHYARASSVPAQKALPEVVVESVPLIKGGKLIPRKPYCVQPYMEDGLFIAKHEATNLHVFEETWDEMVFSIHDELDFLWRNYAHKDDVKLAKDAQALKIRLHEYFEMHS